LVGIEKAESTKHKENPNAMATAKNKLYVNLFILLPSLFSTQCRVENIGLLVIIKALSR
jgi:hypothetical protein